VRQGKGRNNEYLAGTMIGLEILIENEGNNYGEEGFIYE